MRFGGRAQVEVGGVGADLGGLVPASGLGCEIVAAGLLGSRRLFSSASLLFQFGGYSRLLCRLLPLNGLVKLNFSPLPLRKLLIPKSSLNNLRQLSFEPQAHCILPFSVVLSCPVRCEAQRRGTAGVFAVLPVPFARI